MLPRIPLLILLVGVFASLKIVSAQYEATWESLDSRPLPTWYDEAKFGIFIHWGVFSVPSFRSEWFWSFWLQRNYTEVIQYMKDNYPPGFTYADFARDFTAEFFDPDEWADIFQSSGARYVVLTSKHHEGYTLWPSKYSFSWNAMDVGPKRDLVGDLAQSIRSKTDLRFGLYHSLFEWFNPLYVADEQGLFKNRTYAETKAIPELYELINTYQPEVLWSDGDAGPDHYWQSQEFLAWLYNESPVKDTIVTNDRWCTPGCSCEHGDFYTCSDRYNPGVLQPHKWENCMTVDSKSWGFRREAKLEDYLGIEELLSSLITTVSCAGNLLLNVGPTKEGKISPIYEERLRQMGQWLSVNGEAIYSTQPWSYQNDTVSSGVWYTKKDDSLYAMVLSWPADGSQLLAAPQLGPDSTISMLGYDGDLEWTNDEQGILVNFPDMADVSSQWAWTLKMTGVSN